MERITDDVGVGVHRTTIIEPNGMADAWTLGSEVMVIFSVFPSAAPPRVRRAEMPDKVDGKSGKNIICIYI